MQHTFEVLNEIKGDRRPDSTSGQRAKPSSPTWQPARETRRPEACFRVIPCTTGLLTPHLRYFVFVHWSTTLCDCADKPVFNLKKVSRTLVLFNGHLLTSWCNPSTQNQTRKNYFLICLSVLM